MILEKRKLAINIVFVISLYNLTVAKKVASVQDDYNKGG